jgi:hypothetical protein
VEVIKWIGAFALSIIALSLAGSILATILTVSAIMAGVTIIFAIIYIVAAGIKEYFAKPPRV